MRFPRPWAVAGSGDGAAWVSVPPSPADGAGVLWPRRAVGVHDRSSTSCGGRRRRDGRRPASRCNVGRLRRLLEAGHDGAPTEVVATRGSGYGVSGTAVASTRKTSSTWPRGAEHPGRGELESATEQLLPGALALVGGDQRWRRAGVPHRDGVRAPLDQPASARLETDRCPAGVGRHADVVDELDHLVRDHPCGNGCTPTTCWPLPVRTPRRRARRLPTARLSMVGELA